MTTKKACLLLVCSILFCVATFTISCDPPKAVGATEFTNDSQNGGTEKVYQINGVVKIFMHEPGKFTYWYVAPGYTNYLLSFTLSSDNIIIVLDSEKGSWVKYWGESANQNCVYQEIHLQTLDVVGGAGWVRQSGDDTIKGSTTVVK